MNGLSLLLLLLTVGTSDSKPESLRFPSRQRRWLPLRTNANAKANAKANAVDSPNTKGLPKGLTKGLALDLLENASTDDSINETTDLMDNSSNANAPMNTTNGLIGGALAALFQNPRMLAKWSLTGLQVGIVYMLGHAVWQAAQEVLSELDEQTSGTPGNSPTLKPNAVTHVLEELEKQEDATNHFALYRIAQRLQHVTQWQLFDTPTDQTKKPSLQRLLLSLTRNEYSILEQCLYIPTSNEDPRLVWNHIHGIPDIQQAVVDRLHAINFCPQHNPYAPILKDNHAGLLFYGPPGCGKSMLLQAVCSTMRAPCLILTPSVLLKKYVGETNSLIRSLFQLGQKLGGCVICLDELDGLFRERRHDEHDSSRELKTEFMQWWDGLKNDPDTKILIVGATNRPFDVDPAILRRMSQSHFVGLPMAPARSIILQKILEQLPTAPDINLTEIALATENFAPSDLVQLVRTAAQQGPLRDGRGNHSNFRPLTQYDLMVARQQVGPTPLSNDYRNSLIQFHQQQRHQHQQQQHPPQQNQNQQQQNQQQNQNQQQQMAVQSTQWGNFYHAGTYSAEDLEEDDSEEDDTNEDFEEDWEDETENNFSEDEDP